MEQQKTSFEAIICSLNAIELHSMILQLSEDDTSLFDRIVGMIRFLFPDKRIINDPKCDPREILLQANRILHPSKMCRSDYYQMEIAGNSYDDLLLSLQEMFRFNSKAEIIQILQGLTEMVSKNLDRIMDDCDEGIPWHSLAEQLGKYWLQLISCKDLVETDHTFLFSFYLNVFLSLKIMV